MTFRDKSTHFLSITSIVLHTACWAPDVQAPTPKQSPAELANLAIASASAGPTVHEMGHDVGDNQDRHQEVFSSDEQIDTEEVGQSPHQPRISPQQSETKKQLETTNSPERIKSYPYTIQLKGTAIPLLGHGGGVIMTLDTNALQQATIEVLEERNNKLRVLCKGCSSAHPYQAGWISSDYIERLN